jgi:hypothetical protein
MDAHEHFCNVCMKTYDCTRSVCKLIFIYKCISCQLLEEVEKDREVD